MHTHTHSHTHAYTHTHTSTCARTRTCTDARKHAHAHTRPATPHARARARDRARTRARAHTHTRARARAHTRTDRQIMTQIMTQTLKTKRGWGATDLLLVAWSARLKKRLTQPGSAPRPEPADTACPECMIPSPAWGSALRLGCRQGPSNKDARPPSPPAAAQPHWCPGQKTAKQPRSHRVALRLFALPVLASGPHVPDSQAAESESPSSAKTMWSDKGPLALGHPTKEESPASHRRFVSFGQAPDIEHLRRLSE
jgi:hypothetical protein